MAKDEAAGPGGAVAAAAVAAMEKHIAMHSIYAIPPSAGAMPPSPQTQRPGGLKHSSSREEAAQEEQDYLSTPHSKYSFFKVCFMVPCYYRKTNNFSRNFYNAEWIEKLKARLSI